MLPAEMPRVLEWFLCAMPLTYGIDSMQQLALGAGWADVRGAIGAIALFVVGAIVLGVVTLRRRTP